MRVLIVSDTHGRIKNLEKIIKKEKEIDLLIHLGDIEGDEERIRELISCPIEMVRGNNDFFNELEQEKIINIGDYKILLTHGHYYYVGFGSSRIKDIAAEQGCDIVMFGHTHRPLIETKGSVWAINPGSISFPRQEGRKATYVIMDTSFWGESMFELKYV